MRFKIIKYKNYLPITILPRSSMPHYVLFYSTQQFQRYIVYVPYSNELVLHFHFQERQLQFFSQPFWHITRWAGAGRGSAGTKAQLGRFFYRRITVRRGQSDSSEKQLNIVFTSENYPSATSAVSWRVFEESFVNGYIIFIAKIMYNIMFVQELNFSISASSITLPNFNYLL